MIRISAKTAGFRRCGIAHSAEAADYPDGRFTPQELARLKAEPELLVEIVAESENKPKPDKKA